MIKSDAVLLDRWDMAWFVSSVKNSSKCLPLLCSLQDPNVYIPIKEDLAHYDVFPCICFISLVEGTFFINLVKTNKFFELKTLNSLWKKQNFFSENTNFQFLRRYRQRRLNCRCTPRARRFSTDCIHIAGEYFWWRKLKWRKRKALHSLDIVKGKVLSWLFYIHIIVYLSVIYSAKWFRVFKSYQFSIEINIFIPNQQLALSSAISS